VEQIRGCFLLFAQFLETIASRIFAASASIAISPDVAAFQACANLSVNHDELLLSGCLPIGYIWIPAGNDWCFGFSAQSYRRFFERFMATPDYIKTDAAHVATGPTVMTCGCPQMDECHRDFAAPPGFLMLRKRIAG